MSVALAVEMRRLEKEKRTGVLHAGDGAFHFADGAITSADCRRTTGLDRLVVAAGVATTEDWQLAGTGDPRNVLGRPQLETLALLSVFDAAYFLMSSPAVAEFRSTPPHWLASVCHITPHALVHECERRGDPESAPWPAELVDRVAVRPVRRIRRRRVVLTGGQAEVLAAADTRLSIAEIARDLGRTTYGCLAAVRELTTAGLIEPPTELPAEPAAGASGLKPPARRRVRPVAEGPVLDRCEPVDLDVLVRLRAALEELA